MKGKKDEQEAERQGRREHQHQRECGGNHGKGNGECGSQGNGTDRGKTEEGLSVVQGDHSEADR